MSKIIDFNATGYSKRMNEMKSIALDLTKLVESYYEMQVVANKGISLNRLVYDENYINDLLSDNETVKKLKFKNNSELYKFYIDENEYNEFNLKRQFVKNRLERLHIPTDNYTIDAKTGIVQFKEGVEEKIKKAFEIKIDGDSQMCAYDLLIDLMDGVKKIQEICGINSQVVRGMNIDLRQWYLIKDGDIKPSLRGIERLSELISLKQKKSFSAETTVI
tara:strand:- start:527 stop:1183 length:657 start_codon:yes stop_codon:yes gene_type:complete